MFKMFFFRWSEYRQAWGVSFSSDDIDRENLDLLTIGDGVVVVAPQEAFWSVRSIEKHFTRDERAIKQLNHLRGQMLFIGRAYTQYHALDEVK